MEALQRSVYNPAVEDFRETEYPMLKGSYPNWLCIVLLCFKGIGQYRPAGHGDDDRLICCTVNLRQHANIRTTQGLSISTMQAPHCTRSP